MSTPATYSVKIDFPAHKLGDVWDGVASIGPVLVNGSTPAGTLARIRMHFVQSGQAKFKLDTDSSTTPDAPITIDDDVSWEAHIPKVADFLPAPGWWNWDMEFYESGEDGQRTFYYGSIWVEGDVTKDD